MRSLTPRHVLLTLLVCSLTTLFACQGKGSEPTAPAAPADAHLVLDPATPLEVGGAWAGEGAGIAPMGRFQLHLNGDQATIEHARLGQAMVGQHFNVDLTDAFTGGFCNTCLTLDSVQRQGSDLLVTLAVTHPFKRADDARPPDAQNRRDLWVSNVKGILLANGSQSFMGSTIRLDPMALKNADGYTGMLRPLTGFSANVFPYKIFGAANGNDTVGNFDPTKGWTDYLDAPVGYNVLANGQTARATYQIHLEPGNTRSFELILTAAFSVSSPDRYQRLAPQYFMPAGASPEPWKASVSVAGTLVAFDPDSTTELTFSALDWQQDPALAVEPGFPNPANPRGLAVNSRITGISYSIPGIISQPSVPVDLAGATGTGYASDPYTVTATVANAASAPGGIYLGLAKFVDERDAEATQQPFGTTTFVGPDLRTPYTGVTEFATYALFSVTVTSGPGNCLPVQQVREGRFTLYPGTGVFYRWCRTQAELTAALTTVEGTPGPMPPVDWTTQSVVVACTGRTPQGNGQRQVRVDSVCDDGQGGVTVTLLKGEPIGGCALYDLPAAPFVVAIVDSAAPNASFVEDVYDTCLGDQCEPIDWYVVAKGDAAQNGYADDDGMFILCANEACYQSYGQQLFGSNPLPEIDYERYTAMIICTGYKDTGFPERTVDMLNVCQDNSNGWYQAYYREKEYLSCPPPGESGPSAPFVIVAVPQVPVGWDWTAQTVDICTASQCESTLPFQILAQGDVRSQVAGPARFERFQAAIDFDAAWATYFPELAIPSVDFNSTEVYLLSLSQELDTGNRWIEVTDLCLTADDEIKVRWNHWRPVTSTCPRPDGLPGRPVVFITAPKQAVPTTVTFDERPVDSCNVPSCTTSLPTVLDTGDAAHLWGSKGTDLVLQNAAELKRVWDAVYDDGREPPVVDFSAFFVVFTTSGYEAQGRTQFETEVKNSCTVNTRGAVAITERAPETCPPPVPPEDTAPFQFARISRGSGPITGPHVWFGFDHEQVDRCAPGGECVPERAIVISVGSYCNTNTLPVQELVSSQTELETAWAEFFDFPGEVPVLDFEDYDAILQSAGWTEGGGGSRGLWFTGMCVDQADRYVRLDAHRDDWEWEACPLAEDDPANPWVLALLPKGAADGWTVEIDYTVDIPQECEGSKWVLPAMEIAASYSSNWESTASNVKLFNQVDYAERVNAFLAEWAYYGTGDPPGLEEIGEYDAILLVADGWWETNWGKHDLLLNSMTIGWDFQWQFIETVRVLPSS
ncbi:MAG TPA: hypothetical protein VEI97_06915, partial [bacterium]|nr:hypothetical protein [bacterium]